MTVRDTSQFVIHSIHIVARVDITMHSCTLQQAHYDRYRYLSVDRHAVLQVHFVHGLIV